MTPTLAGVIGLAVFLVIIMMLRMPIAYAMAIVGFAGYSILVSPSAAFRLVSIDIFTNFASYSLTVVPMFIFMGFIALYSGVGGSLFSFSSKFLGHYRGGAGSGHAGCQCIIRSHFRFNAGQRCYYWECCTSGNEKT